MRYSTPFQVGSKEIHAIASIAKIPTHARGDLPETFEHLLDKLNFEEQFDPFEQAVLAHLDDTLTPLASAAKTLGDIIANLDEYSVHALGMYAMRQEEFGAYTDQVQMRDQIKCLGRWSNRDRLLVQRMLQQVRDIETAANTRMWPTSATAKGGRPPKSDVENPAFGAFYRFAYFLELSIVFRGGRTTLNDNVGTGTFLEILRILVPFVPPTIVPDFLSKPDECEVLSGITRLKRVKNQAAKAAKNALQPPWLSKRVGIY